MIHCWPVVRHLGGGVVHHVARHFHHVIRHARRVGLVKATVGTGAVVTVLVCAEVPPWLTTGPPPPSGPPVAWEGPPPPFPPPWGFPGGGGAGGGYLPSGPDLRPALGLSGRPGEGVLPLPPPLVVADRTIPEPGSAWLLLAPLVLLFTRRRNRGHGRFTAHSRTGGGLPGDRAAAGPPA